jgi:glycerol-3-phosphate acyltransferase PlsY
MSWNHAAWILGAYILGSVSFADIIGRGLKGIDLRTVGSGNLGATNVGRALGGRWGLLVYLLDFLKGLGPVLIAARFLDDPRAFGDTVPLAVLMGGAAVIGHCFPAHLGFRGGKGVATTSGTVLGLSPLVFLVGLACFVVFTKLTRMVAVGSCAAALALPASHAALSGSRVFNDRAELSVFCLYAGLALLVLGRHHTNIAKILRGTESKLGDELE